MTSSSWSPGAQVGPYRLVNRLGAGGMGEVFLADDDRLARRVAIKRLRQQGADPRGARRLLREARAAAVLSHPNIATVYDVLDEGGTPAIVMEYIEGETLAQRLTRGALPADEARSLGRQLAGALAAAHQAGIIHRDLKPGNIVIGNDGRPRILDFGLAGPSLEEQAHNETMTADVVVERNAGTPAYMSPERLSGAVADERGDIYALGVMLYEAMLGARPFRGDTAFALAAAIIDGPAPDPRLLDEKAGPQLADVIRRAMARNPAERFASARELAAALSTNEATARVTTVPLPVGPARGARARLIAAAAVSALVVAGAAWWFWPRQSTMSSAAGEVLMVAPLADGTGGGPPYTNVAASISQMALSSVTRAADIRVVRGPGFDGTSPTSPEADARAQGASLVLAGRVQSQPPSRLRVYLTLARSDSGTVVWTEHVDGAADDYFALERPLDERVRAGLAAARLPVKADTSPAGTEHASTDNQAAYNAYVRGRGLLLRRDVAANREAAITAFEDAIAADDSFALAWAGLAEAAQFQYRATDDPSWASRAEQALDRAVELAPSQFEVRFARGRLLFSRGEAERAVNEAREAIRLAPGNDDAHRLLGEALIRTGQREEGLREIRRAIALRPGYWEHHQALGFALYGEGQFAAAADAFRSLIAIVPDSARGYLLAGSALMADDRATEALAQFEEAQRRDPNEGDAFANAGTVLYWQGRIDEARAQYAKAVAMRPGDALFRRMLGDAEARMGRTVEAAKAWNEAARLTETELRVSPKDARAQSYLAVLRAKLGNSAEALALARAAVARDPKNAEVVYNAAAVYALTGKTADARSTLETALALGYPRTTAKYDDDVKTAR